jgi:hypothetical protein
MYSPFVRPSAYHLNIEARNTRPAASESAIGGLQISLRTAASVKLPAFWTNVDTQEESS